MDPELVAILERIRVRAEALDAAGTHVWAPGSRVAYAFVVPCEARNDLADALADYSFYISEGQP